MRNLFLCILLFFAGAISGAAEMPSIRENSFQPDRPVLRARRPFKLTAVIENEANTPFEPRVILPEGAAIHRIRKQSPDALGRVVVDADVICSRSGQADWRLELLVDDKVVQKSTITTAVLPPRMVEKLDYIPPPRPVKTSYLIGAHNCPLWETEQAHLWNQVVRKHQERTPALGIYSQDNPEIADWETKWAVEHGISFFIYCWYRTSQGGPVTTKYEKSVFDDALFRSRYGDQMKITLMWENQSKGSSGIADEKDLLENLMPYWIGKYFKRDNYLKIDNKPVLFIYRPTFVANDLGGDDKAKAAFDLMRQACRDAGFDGLILLGEYRGTDRKVLERFRNLGLDYTFAYCWPIPNSPAPAEAVAAQMRYIRQTQEYRDVLPQVVTLSQAWSGWRDEGSLWKLPPDSFETLLREAKQFIDTEMPKNELGSRMLILDNWNEWSEGHYIAPYREYGFGYLDAVRRVFAESPEPHEDLIPEDIGLGPYGLPSSLFENRSDWDFVDGRQGWMLMMGLKNLAVKDGMLTFETTTGDPAIRVALDRLPASRFREIAVRMKVSPPRRDMLQVFWIDEASKNFSEARSARAAVSEQEGFHDYVLPLSSPQGWGGRIMELRIDPVATPGVHVEIDSIRLRP